MASNPQSARHRDCVCGECLAIEVPAQDWIVSKVLDRGPGQMYRYHVIGVNLNHPTCHPDRRFSWLVPAMCERYDLSNAERIG